MSHYFLDRRYHMLYEIIVANANVWGWSKFNFALKSPPGDTGVYIVYFDHSPPPPHTFEINFFPVEQRCGGRLKGVDSYDF